MNMKNYLVRTLVTLELNLLTIHNSCSLSHKLFVYKLKIKYWIPKLYESKLKHKILFLAKNHGSATEERHRIQVLMLNFHWSGCEILWMGNLRIKIFWHEKQMNKWYIEYGGGMQLLRE